MYNGRWFGEEGITIGTIVCFPYLVKAITGALKENDEKEERR